MKSYYHMYMYILSGLEPFVTLYEQDMPQSLEESYAGLLSPLFMCVTFFLHSIHVNQYSAQFPFCKKPESNLCRNPLKKMGKPINFIFIKIDTNIHTYIHTYILICMHIRQEEHQMDWLFMIFTHKYIHTYIHTYRYIYI